MEGVSGIAGSGKLFLEGGRDRECRIAKEKKGKKEDQSALGDCSTMCSELSW